MHICGIRLQLDSYIAPTVCLPLPGPLHDTNMTKEWWTSTLLCNVMKKINLLHIILHKRVNKKVEQTTAHKLTDYVEHVQA